MRNYDMGFKDLLVIGLGLIVYSVCLYTTINIAM